MPPGHPLDVPRVRRPGRALARGLLVGRLQAGDRVGIWSPNYAEWTLVQYATAEIGVILVNINPAYRTHELAYVLEQSGCRMLIAAPAFKTSDYRAMVDEVRADCPSLEQVVFLWDAGVGRLRRRRVDDRRRRSTSARATLGADDAINIQYTSGTTGFPKGATLSHRNILNNGCFVAELQGFTTDDRLCIPVPFYHCFGMVMGNLGCTTHGATMVIPADAFEPLARCCRRCRTSGAPRSTACPRCSSPSSAHDRLRPLRPVVAAHRRDGRLAVPGRGDEGSASTGCTWTR